MVGLAGLRAHLRQRLDYLPQMRRTTPRQQSLLDALPIGQQTNAVAGEERELRE